MFQDSSTPVKASNFNPLNPDLLTLYRRPNPIKIWPTYAIPPTTSLYPCLTYDLWRTGSSSTIFQPVEKLIPLKLPRPLRAGPTNHRCILDQHTLSPIKVWSLPISLCFQSGRERGLIGSLVWTGLIVSLCDKNNLKWIFIPYHVLWNSLCFISLCINTQLVV